ncbi:SHOCT domain-containing protein [Streptomyces sulphureus]|uniref:SHOCT domain-containing protein n=1 Tax=Streptomyces sulphureus TaxID=47758 RepID=UPI0003710CA7|nr:hypothetical protein [Streptomyces sulphureus]
MEILAYWHHGGPGPWVLFFPLVWALVVVGVILTLRRTVWRRRGGWGPYGGGWGPHAAGEDPRTLLGRRFARGEIDEQEYRSRRSVLDEFGPVEPRPGEPGGPELKKGPPGGER